MTTRGRAAAEQIGTKKQLGSQSARTDARDMVKVQITTGEAAPEAGDGIRDTLGLGAGRRSPGTKSYHEAAPERP